MPPWAGGEIRLVAAGTVGAATVFEVVTGAEVTAAEAELEDEAERERDAAAGLCDTDPPQPDSKTTAASTAVIGPVALFTVPHSDDSEPIVAHNCLRTTVRTKPW
jgi:hypothetical protein